MAAPEQIGANRMFGGVNRRYRHDSATLGCPMTFTVFFPPGSEDTGDAPVPVLYWLSGLTCTDENFIQKSGAQRSASAHRLALVAPDTSPRGLGVEGEADCWDFGVGAGFYLNATQPQWKAWRMYDYVTEELPGLLAQHFPQLDTARASVSGHSMGGHGALVIALRNPGVYKSVSAFAPICNPTTVPWGIKAFKGYLGGDEAEWRQYDACVLIRAGAKQLPLLVDTGTADNFVKVQLKPEALEAACKEAGWSATLRMQEGYDHSYFFIATFIEEHVAFHAQALKRG